MPVIYLVISLCVHKMKKGANHRTNASWSIACKAVLLRSCSMPDSVRWRTQQWHPELPQLARFKARLGKGFRERKGRRKVWLVGLSFWLCWECPQRVMPCPSLCSLTTYCPLHPCHVGNAAPQTWLLALESHWSLNDNWVRMDDSCGGGAWEVLWQVSHECHG